MKKLGFLLLLAASAFGQSTAGPFVISSGTSACATIDVSGQSAVGISVTGTFSATLQPEVAIQGQAATNIQVTPSTSSTAQSTITAAGNYTASVGGYSTFLVCVTAYTSGAATIRLNTVKTTASNGGTGGSGGGGGVTGFDTITGGTNLTAAMINGAGSSLSPLNPGQTAGNQVWFPSGLPSPTLTLNTTGGNILNGHRTWVQYVLNTAAGITRPSPITNVNASSCSGGTQCSVTVTQPTLASGYTGYTVYSCDNSSITACAPLRQNALPACVNITGNCIIQTAGAGAAPPTLNTAYLQPPNVQAGCGNTVSQIVDGLTPNWFLQKPDGNFYPYGGVDSSTSPKFNGPYGVFTLCGPLSLNDTTANQSAFVGGTTSICCALFSWAHEVGDIIPTSLAANDWASIWTVHMDKTVTPSVNAVQGTYGELWIDNNNITLSGAPDAMVTARRELVVDARSAGSASLGNITSGIQGVFEDSRTGTANLGSCFPCGSGLIGQLALLSSVSAGGVFYAGVQGLISGGGTQNTGTYYALMAHGSALTGASTEYGGLYISSLFSNSLGNGYAIRSDGTAKSILKGPNYFPAGGTPGNATFTLGSSESLTGSLTTTALAQPTFNNGNVQVVGTPGAATWTYVIAAVDGNGKESIKSGNGGVTTGNATLDSSNLNFIQFTCVPGPTSYNVYRTAVGTTPNTTGKIATGIICQDLYAPGGNQAFLSDNGLAGDGSTPPTVNGSGGVLAPLFATSTDCAVNSVSPAACGTSASGAFVVPTTTATYTVNTSAATTNAHIFLQARTYTGGLPGTPTCVAPAVTSAVVISARTAATSFTFALPSTVGQTCWDYWIVSN